MRSAEEKLASLGASGDRRCDMKRCKVDEVRMILPCYAEIAITPEKCKIGPRISVQFRFTHAKNRGSLVCALNAYVNNSYRDLSS